MTMTAQEMIDYVNRLYVATGAGDWDTVEGMLTDDFFVTEADDLPMAGEYRGAGGLRALFTKVMGLCDVANIDMIDMTVGKDHVVALAALRFTDPSLAPAELCEVFMFRDGKCCQIKPYYYDATTVQAACKAKAAA